MNYMILKRTLNLTRSQVCSMIHAYTGSLLAQTLCSLPAVTAMKITAVDNFSKVTVHPSFLAGLSASTRLRCLDVEVSLSNDRVCALSRLTGLEELHLSCPKLMNTNTGFSPLCALHALRVLSLKWGFKPESNNTWLAQLKDLQRLYVVSMPSGPLQLPSSLQELEIKCIYAADLPRLVQLCTGWLPGLKLVMIQDCKIFSGELDRHARGTELSTKCPEQLSMMIGSAYVYANIDESFFTLCERAPVFGSAIRELTLESLQHTTCSRLGAVCPNLTRKSKEEDHWITSLPCCFECCCITSGVVWKRYV